MADVPKALRRWFLIHFIVDFIFAIPLFIAPTITVRLLGFYTAEPFATRLVAAALFGIGGASLWAHKKGKKEFEVMLTLKIIWSLAAIAGLLITIAVEDVVPQAAWGLVIIFAIFSAAWIYYKRKL